MLYFVWIQGNVYVIICKSLTSQRYMQNIYVVCKYQNVLQTTNDLLGMWKH